MSSKIFERNKVALVTTAATWWPMKEAERVAAMAYALALDSAETVTIQLRKATDSAGTHPANLGAAVVGTSTGTNQDILVKAEAQASDLGVYNNDATTPYTHVSATVTVAASPEVAGSAILLFSDLKHKPPL